MLKDSLKGGEDIKNNVLNKFTSRGVKEDQIILVRDQVGVKPLYIYEDSNIFAFSSEIKSLLKFGSIKKEINYESIYDYLTFQNIS